METLFTLLANFGQWVMRTEWNGQTWCDRCAASGDLVPAYSLVPSFSNGAWHHEFLCREHCEKYVCHHCGYTIIVGADAFAEFNGNHYHFDCWYDDDNADYVNPIAKGMTAEKIHVILKGKYEHSCEMYRTAIERVREKNPTVSRQRKVFQQETVSYWHGRCEAFMEAIDIIEGLYN